MGRPASTLRGKRIRLDSTPHSTVLVCDACRRNFGPYPTAAAARAAALAHWDEWHRTHPTTEGCVMPGCDAPHLALGYCRKHYMRVRRTGDPSIRTTRRNR